MDELVKRLREGTYASYDQCTDAWLAADRIEALETELRLCQAERERAQKACEQIAERAALAGEKKDE